MSAGWQAGDLAMRVRKGSPCPFCGTPPSVAPGQIRLVSDVRVLLLSCGLSETLFFEGEPEVEVVGLCRHIGHDPAFYRKITPPQADAFDREVIAALTGQPVLEPQA